MNIIENNPYRTLGVFANSPTKERVANAGKIIAFAKVGKKVTFPTDLSHILSAPVRTPESVKSAEGALALPKEHLRYAQFWLVSKTAFDDVAFTFLFSGEIDQAMEIWRKKEDASALQNLVVCGLIKNDYDTAVGAAVRLYSDYIEEYLTLIEDDTACDEDLVRNFLEGILEDGETERIAKLVKQTDLEWWERIFSDLAVKPILAKLDGVVTMADGTKNKGPEVRLAAGKKLMAEGYALLKKLRILLSASDLLYQTMADKYAISVLQCAIDYYNDTEDADCAHTAIELMRHACDVAVGAMAKERCQKNVDIVQRAVDRTPPREIVAARRAVDAALDRHFNSNKNITNAMVLLNVARPHLLVLKAKLGIRNAEYLKLSTCVVNAALNYVVEEVNNANRENTLFPSLDSMKRREIVEKAYNALHQMEMFDMEADYVRTRFAPNKKTLERMYTAQCLMHSSYNQRTAPHNPSADTGKRQKSVGDAVETLYIIAGFAISAIVGTCMDGLRGMVCAMAMFVAFAVWGDTLYRYKKHAPANRTCTEKGIMGSLRRNSVVFATLFLCIVGYVVSIIFSSFYTAVLMSVIFWCCMIPAVVLDLKASSRFSLGMMGLASFCLSFFLAVTTVGYETKANEPIADTDSVAYVSEYTAYGPVPDESSQEQAPGGEASQDETSQPEADHTQEDLQTVAEEREDPDAQWVHNQLPTGSKPYSPFYGTATDGDNTLRFNTRRGSDYVVIVRKGNGAYVNHVYIRGGETAEIYVPDGLFDVYFYSGTGWNPEKENGNVIGGFVCGEGVTKDKNLYLNGESIVYTLYAVQNGNLRLANSNKKEAL